MRDISAEQHMTRVWLNRNPGPQFWLQTAEPIITSPALGNFCRTLPNTSIWMGRSYSGSSKPTEINVGLWALKKSARFSGRLAGSLTSPENDEDRSTECG